MVEPNRPTVFLAYVSAYGFTGEMAKHIADSIKATGEVEVILADIEHWPVGDMESAIIRSTGLLVGCPTLNQNILLPVYKLFSAVSPIRDRGKLAGAFGSYGWSGEGVKLIEENLKNLKLSIPVPGVAAKFNPHGDTLKALEDFGRDFANEMVRQHSPVV